MLSRLHRRAEALDEACLRALGHPTDPAIQQELLAALEWDASFHPDHARPSIRGLFKDVHGHSSNLSNRLQDGPSSAGDGSHPIAHSIDRLRRSLADLTSALAERRDGHDR